MLVPFAGHPLALTHSSGAEVAAVVGQAGTGERGAGRMRVGASIAAIVYTVLQHPPNPAVQAKEDSYSLLDGVAEQLGVFNKNTHFPFTPTKPSPSGQGGLVLAAGRGN